MLRLDRKSILFLIATFLFILGVVELFPFDAVSDASIAMDVAISAVFIVYATSYLLYSGRPDRYSSMERLLPWLFSAVIILLAAHVSFALVSLHASSSFLFYEPFYLLEALPAALPMILPIIFGAIIWRAKVPRKYAEVTKAFACTLLAIGIAVVMIVLLFGLFTQNFYVSDEQFITINAAFAASSGHNPYAMNFTAQLYSYSTAPTRSVAYTYTTNNTFESGVDYPALSFLATMPVALLYKLLYHSIDYKAITLAELGVFISIFLVILAFVLDRERAKRLDIAVVAFVLLFLISFSSHLDYLVLISAILAFYIIDSKYLWIVLGLAASLQELLWVAVILFIVYTFRNHGARRGILTIMGTAAIFLMINGYFIAAGPSQYFSQVLAPESGYIIPSSGAPFGYALVTLYNVLLSSSNVLFYAAILSVIIAFAYLNEKRLIFLFSLVPLMFLFRGIYPYYIFFLPLTVLTLFVTGRKAAKGRARPFYMNAAIASISVIAIVSALLLIQSHNMFASAGISVTGQQLVTGQVANYTLYNATLHYGAASPAQLSAVEYVMYYSLPAPTFLGLSQGNLLVMPVPMRFNSSIGYLVNPNRIDISNSGGSLNISLLVPNVLVLVNGSSGPVNATIPSNAPRLNAIVYTARCVLYSNAYYYTCPNAYAKQS